MAYRSGLVVAVEGPIPVRFTALSPLPQIPAGAAVAPGSQARTLCFDRGGLAGRRTRNGPALSVPDAAAHGSARGRGLR